MKSAFGCRRYLERLQLYRLSGQLGHLAETLFLGI